jgi:glycosyltransferase involved in cell wall biosynthesis
MYSDDEWIAGTMYLRNLIYCLASLPSAERPEVRLLGVSDETSSIVRELREFDFVDPATQPYSKELTSSGRWWRRIKRKFMQSVSGRSDHPGSNSVDLTYPGWGVAIPGAARMYWVPEFQHVHLPHLFSQDEANTRADGIERIAHKSGILVLSSNVTLTDFQQIHQDATITPRVWSFCTILTDWERGGKDPFETHGLPEKYLYLPNQFWLHKDHKTAFQAIAILKEKGIEIPLVCTGHENDRRNPDHFSSLMSFLAERGIQSQVRTLGLLPRNDQIEIFRYAAAVLQPSLFEGWSTAVEDTKAIGRPIILSDIPVHREQVSRDAWFFKPSSPKDLANLLEELWPKLKAGPDTEAEREAATLTETRRLAAATEFMIMAREALALYRNHAG